MNPIAETVEQQEVIDLWMKRSDRLREIAGLLGSSTGRRVNNAKRLLATMSRAVADHEVVLTLPSLDLGLTDDGDGSTCNPLPSIGTHAAETSMGQGEDVPAMTASVLTSATEGVTKAESNAAQSIGKLTSWTKSTLEFAADAARNNLSDSFAALVESRVKAWTLLLLKHSLSTGDDESRSRLLSILSSSISVVSSSSQFKTLDFKSNSALARPKEGDIVLPLLFEVALTVSVQGKDENVVLRAPGTITAHFEQEAARNCDVTKVAVRLTTSALVNSMVEQARLLVLKNVASAAKVPVDEPGKSLSPMKEKTVVTANSTLSGFRSALNLPTTASSSNSSPRLQKARSSALRLNSVLHQKPSSSDSSYASNMKIRKTRSVKWDAPVQAPKIGSALAPSPKKQKKALNAARLKSLKSFGRPHGEGGSGPRNATFAFGEFGPQRFWGRDGRLAHHPQPMQQMPDLLSQATEASNTNATFDISHTPTQHMPRSTTALEVLFLKKSTNATT